MGMFDWLFGKKKDEKVQTKYEGPKPYSSLTEFPVGKSLNDIILQGLTGKGWGFPEGYIDRATSPFIEQLRVNAPKTQREVQDVYSARGLGRGTAAARDVGEVAAQRERDINQILSQVYMADIAQRKQDEANAIARGQTFAGAEAATRTGAGSFGLSQMIAEREGVSYNNALNEAIAKGNMADLGMLLKTGAGIAGSVATGNPMYAIGAIGGMDAGGYTLKDLIDEQQKRQNKAFTK